MLVITTLIVQYGLPIRFQYIRALAFDLDVRSCPCAQAWPLHTLGSPLPQHITHITHSEGQLRLYIHATTTCYTSPSALRLTPLPRGAGRYEATVQRVRGRGALDLLYSDGSTGRLPLVSQHATLHARTLHLITTPVATAKSLTFCFSAMAASVEYCRSTSALMKILHAVYSNLEGIPAYAEYRPDHCSTLHRVLQARFRIRHVPHYDATTAGLQGWLGRFVCAATSVASGLVHSC